MTAVAVWIACSPLVGAVIGRFIGAGMVDRARKGKP